MNKRRVIFWTSFLLSAATVIFILLAVALTPTRRRRPSLAGSIAPDPRHWMIRNAHFIDGYTAPAGIALAIGSFASVWFLCRYLPTEKGPARRRVISWTLSFLVITATFAVTIVSFRMPRKRGRSTRIIEDLRMIDAAIDQYAIEFNKPLSEKERLMELRQEDQKLKDNGAAP